MWKRIVLGSATTVKKVKPVVNRPIPPLLDARCLPGPRHFVLLDLFGVALCGITTQL